MLEVVSVGNDAVFVPVFFLNLRLNLFGLADLRRFFDFELAVLSNQLSGLAALSQNAAKRFAVQNSRIRITSFKVRLISADAPLGVGQFKAAVLNPGVTVYNLVFKFKLKVIDFTTTPDDERVTAELARSFSASFTCNDAITNTPDVRIAVPVFERLAVEK